MYRELELSPRFAKLQMLMGIWITAGIGVFFLAAREAFFGAIFLLVAFAMLGALVAGRLARKRPYNRMELTSVWVGIPIFVTTLGVLLGVGFLPTSYLPIAALYIVAIFALYLLMIIEARRGPER